MTDWITITEEEFEARFSPRGNHLNPNASWQVGHEPGCLFETFGEEGHSQSPLARTRAKLLVRTRSASFLIGRNVRRLITMAHIPRRRLHSAVRPLPQVKACTREFVC